MQPDLVVVILYSSICNYLTTVQNNDNEISLHFKPMRLIFMNYSVMLPQVLLFIINTIYHSETFQPANGQTQGVILIHFSSKFDKMNPQI